MNLRSTFPRTVSMAALALAVFSSTASADDLFVKPAGSGSACTQSSPCTLATALATAGADDAIFLAGGVYAGAGTEVVLLDTTVSLLGGWSGAPAGAVVRDPVAYESILDGQGTRRVVKITGGAPILDGLTVTGGDASGQAQGCGASGASPDGCGGGIFVASAGMTLRECRITDNFATTNAANPALAGYGGGVYGFLTGALLIEGSSFRGNVASTAGPGYGGALEVADARAALTLKGNRFNDNKGTTSIGKSGYGGAVSLHNCLGYPVEVAENVFDGNVARATPYDSSTNSDGNALYTYGSASALRRNAIRSDAHGFAVAFILSDAEVTGNTVISQADNSSLYFFYGIQAQSVVTNNILVGGSSATLRAHGNGGSPVTLEVMHNTIVNNAAGTGVLIGEDATATLTNNIVSGHATAIRTTGTGAVTADHTLFWNNVDDGIRGTNPIDGYPRFVNAAAGNFHVEAGSAAVNAGIDAGVATDIDGDPRPGPGSVDVGADELAYRAFDFGTPGSPVAWEHTQVTHLTTYTPERGFGWLGGAIGSRDRGGSDDMLRDFCFTQLGTFAVDVPNGRYWITVSAGDLTTAHSQMGIYLEGTLAATLAADANEYAQPRLPVSVADGQLTVLLDDLGGADVNVVINALSIEREPPVRLDLGTAASPVFADYGRISHGSAYSPAAGAGWLGGIVLSRDRGGADALLRDLNFTVRGLFGVFLANGTYEVALTLGDSAGAHDQMGVSVQGAAPEPLTTAKNQFVTRRWRTPVADNRLELLLDDLGGADANVVVNALEVAPPPPPRFDFGTSASNVEPGWVRVTEGTRYSGGTGYGWSAGAVASRDRGTGTRLRQDLNFSRDAVFSVDLLAGRWEVSITMGDAAAGHDQMGVRLEGVLVDTVTTAKGEFATATYTVVVTDGRLDVTLVDLGGADVNAVINALEIR